ncbi:hypothetical protein LSTR_LSTR009164 [Laodelphax striatellus]|uniref:Uncharacterized protein n=1 Tax=Laodelphax striatellus TaxID=195883 RepID=A0A482XEI7_LAOST|nr:hypothetical protein LSTR_LSTR009164 [Laodelphax striatellus]
MVIVVRKTNANIKGKLQSVRIIRLLRRNRVRIGTVNKIQNELKDQIKESFFNTVLEEFCRNCSLHGLSHITRMDRRPYERILWLLLTVFATIGAYRFSYDIWRKYQYKDTATVVETTQYEYANVAFPSVTICDVSRVDWKRVTALKPSDIPLPSGDKASMVGLKILLEALADMTFGDFDVMDGVRKMSKKNFNEIKNVNLSDILLRVMRPCTEVFLYNCWWRNQEFNCCEIFEVQKSEFGFCHSFNSDVSEYSLKYSSNYGLDDEHPYWVQPQPSVPDDSNLYKNLTFDSDEEDEEEEEEGESRVHPTKELRPRRTAGAGPWTGLRVTIKVPTRAELPPSIVMVANPQAMPSGGSMMVTSGTFAGISVWGDAIYTTKRVRGIPVELRKCLYSDEAVSLANHRYLSKNCQQDCWQRYTVRYCNCSPDFLFVSKDPVEYPPCKVEGLLCLSLYNDLFNYEVPETTQKNFYNHIQQGMSCNCLADCVSQQYLTEVTTSQNVNSSNEIQLDVHFRSRTCILYRSDVLFGWLDLIVSIGGIAGLFLGGSLLSGVEILYFSTIRLFHIYKEWKLNRDSKEPDTKIPPKKLDQMPPVCFVVMKNYQEKLTRAGYD